MKKTNQKFHKTPSEFYRNIRPEFFSDSEKTYEAQLPIEVFKYELSQISTNQKQDAFETLGRRLAEIFIAPNLIPQVGPTGGGDGKTDSETYPVSEDIIKRWFIPENGWKKNENWAFAISAKEDWKGKVRKDVKSILGTGRGYTKIYFITNNQRISSRERKDTQDKLNKEFKIEVTILDGQWITESIYNNDLIRIAVDSLNLSDIYKNEKIKVGVNDAYRTKRLEEIEGNISNTNRYFEYDYQLVEDALESATLSRMLEKPEYEVIGKFDRALRLAQKVNNLQQLIRIHYQRAWTYIHWYDKYVNFISEFNKFKEYVKEESNIHNIELYFNLLNVLRGILYNTEISKEILDINFENEEMNYRNVLENCISNTDKPATALIANTYKSFLNIFRSLSNNESASEELKKLNGYFKDSTKYLEYPFESFKKIIELFSEILPDTQDYDNLIDCIAEISESRASELASGEIFLNRGFQKLSKDNYKDGLIYFGKSVRKLAKEESQDYLYFALMGLIQAYRNLGLLWAANNCIIAASGIAFKEWHNEGKLNKRLYRCVEEALKNELFIGRVPYILSWYELFKVISPQFEEELSNEEPIPISELVDASLAVRLLNSPFNTWSNFSILPNLLEKEALWLSQDTALYMLGYLDLIEQRHLEKLSGNKTIDDYYNMMANQPFKEQMVYNTNLLEAEIIEFKSVILGTDLLIRFQRNKELSIFAETLLAFLESFLATSFEEVYPSTETITVTIKDNIEIEWYKIVENNTLYEIQLNSYYNSKISHEKAGEILLDISSKIIAKHFIFKKATEYLEKLYKHDELNERQSLIIEHKKLFMSVFGESPKIFIKDWVKDNPDKKFEFKRTFNPIQINEEIKEKSNISKTDKVQNLKHNQTKVSSIIDINLWDNAHWRGFGFINPPGMPIGIFLAYENGEFGKQIFTEWIKRFGKIDKNEEINLSIIRGVDRDNPFWYRVHISKSLDKNAMQEGHFRILASKFHEMNANNPTNLTNLINGFNHFKHYFLLPALFKPDGTIEPYFNLGILKRKLTIRDAWEIGENDLDCVVIKKEDKPIIPPHKPDAPIINLLKQKEGL